MCVDKTSHFKGDAEHGSENHPPEVADCGGSLRDRERCKRLYCRSTRLGQTRPVQSD